MSETEGTWDEIDYAQERGEPTTAETVLAAFPELRDTGYGAYLDMLDREAERGLAQFRADMARLAEKEGERGEQYLLERAQFPIPTEEKAGK